MAKERKPRQFVTKKGKPTNILNSYDYYKTSYRGRREKAFSPTYLVTLNERDKNLMRGYAQRIVEEQQAYRYHNPDYVRKTK